MLRPRSFERRLFGWLAALALVPALAVLLIALNVGSRSLRSLGTLGPWAGVAESGRALIDAADATSPADTALAAAAARHRTDLSESLRQAGRWEFLGDRVSAAAPVVIAVLVLLLAAAALAVSRRLARQLARPIGELVDWAGRLGRGEPLLANPDGHRHEVREVGLLRSALLAAETEIRAGRERALEAERTRAWGEMARRVAHEMKNPLTPLQLAAHRLDRAAGSDPAMREVADVIREETKRLDELARSFAALGRPAAGPASDVDLGELLTSLIRSDVPETLRAAVETAPGTPMVRGDYDGLARAFRNLVRNAAEAVAARPGAGSIEVRVSALEGGGVEVRIADDGVGIPAGLEDVIFEPDRTLKRGGTGLGLAVVRQVVAAHGGQVRARNRESGGAEFVVRLPAAPRGAREREQPAASAGDHASG